MADALRPDVVATKRGAGVMLRRRRNTLVFAFEGKSIPALRASVNTYLRWVSTVGRVLYELEASH